MADENDALLVTQFLNGEPEAAARLVRRYSRPAFQAACRITRNADHARDICQTVFLKVFQKLDTYRADESFFSWFYRIVVNESLNFVNTRKQVQELPAEWPAGSPGPEHALARSEADRLLEQAIGELPVDLRLPLILRHFLECSYAQAGEILDLPEQTFKSRLYEARRRLLNSLREKGLLSP